MARSLLFLLLALTALQTGSALKCYRCDSVANPDCGHEMRGIDATPCPYTFIPDNNNNSTLSKMISPRMLNFTRDRSISIHCVTLTIKGPSGEEQMVRECARKYDSFDPCASLKNFLNTQGTVVRSCQLCNDTDGCNGYHAADQLTTESTTAQANRHDHHHTPTSTTTTTTTTTEDPHHMGHGSSALISCIGMHMMMATFATTLLT